MTTEGTNRPLPAGAGTRAAISGRWLLPGALLILLVALFLRGKDLDGGAMSPDDGSFLHSARVHELEGGAGPATWLAEDAEWFGELADDFSRVEERTTFQHGYLHQLCIRYAARAGDRLGFGSVAALRLDQAVFGALTVLLVILLLRRVAPREPLVALAGGALLAVQLGHVLKSRTGWGQAACTFFLVWMIAIAWRMYTQAAEKDTKALVRGAFGITVTSLLAYGFHEMATVYTFVLALLVVPLFRTDPDGVGRWPWRSRRVLFGLLGCIPVGALTVGLIAFNEFARSHWFSSSMSEGYTWLQVRQLSWTYLTETVAVARQISWPVLLLAPIGLAGAFTRDMRWLVWLAAWVVLPAALFFLRFQNPSLVRIYLPVDVFLVVLAAEGLGVLWGVARSRLAVALADAVAVLAIGWCAAVTWSTISVGPASPLFVRAVHSSLGEGVHPSGTFDDIAFTLRARAPEQPVAIAFVFDPLFRVLDLGFAAEFVELDALPEGVALPEIVIAPRRAMESAASGRMRVDGGPYALAARDRYDRLGLYVR